MVPGCITYKQRIVGGRQSAVSGDAIMIMENMLNHRKRAIADEVLSTADCRLPTADFGIRIISTVEKWEP
jgi:hypothetical protein